MSVTRKDLARALKEELGGTISGHDEWIQTFLRLMGDQIAHEGRVELRGFGAFQLRKTKAHTTIKPSTGRKMKAPASYTIDFKGGKALKTKIKEANKKSRGRKKKKTKK